MHISVGYDMSHKVSVVIPTYNRPSFLYSAIKSVLNQTFQDFEIIVVDDASTDNTRKVVAEFDEKRICYLRHRENRGGSTARNTGIKRSKGEFIAFLDDDDLWVRSKLEKQLDLFNKKPEIGAVYSGAWIINKSGEIIGYDLPFLRGNILPDMLRKNHVGSCSFVMVRKECFDRIGTFDETLPASQDWDMWVRLGEHYHFDFCHEPLVLYRVHERRITADPYAKMEAARSLFKKFSTSIDTFNNRGKTLGCWHYRFGRIYCEMEDREKGKREFLMAINNDPYSVDYYVRLFASFFSLTTYNALRRLLDSFLPVSFKPKVT